VFTETVSVTYFHIHYNICCWWHAELWWVLCSQC